MPHETLALDAPGGDKMYISSAHWHCYCPFVMIMSPLMPRLESAAICNELITSTLSDLLIASKPISKHFKVHLVNSPPPPPPRKQTLQLQLNLERHSPAAETAPVRKSSKDSNAFGKSVNILSNNYGVLCVASSFLICWFNTNVYLCISLSMSSKRESRR